MIFAEEAVYIQEAASVLSTALGGLLFHLQAVQKFRCRFCLENWLLNSNHIDLGSM